MAHVMFVHTGFLLREDVDETTRKSLKEIRENPAYGSYEEYLRNLEILHNSEKQGSIYVVQSAARELLPYHQRFKPKKGSIVLDWNSEEAPWFMILENKEEGWKPTEAFLEVDAISQLLQYLSRRGVNEIVIAGELGPYSKHSRGCVGNLYQMFKSHLPVMGVKGCIFPLIPDKERISEEYIRGYMDELGFLKIDPFKDLKQLYVDLYDNAIPLEQLV